MPPPQSSPSSADDMSISLVRSIANYTASKLSSSLSETEISLLSDDALGELIGAELSRLPEDELNRFAEDELSLFVLPILQAVFSNHSSPLNAAANVKAEEITTHNYHQVGLLVMVYFGCLFFMTSFMYLAPIIHKFWQELSAKILSRDVVVTTIDTHKKEKHKLKPLERSIFLSKYSSTSEFKGLKGIAETYARQTDTGIRQFIIQESFVNGESFSLPAIRPCDKTKEKDKEIQVRSLMIFKHGWN